MKLFRNISSFCTLFVLLCSSASAQFQVPDHAVPIGRGGNIQGFRNAAPGTADRPFVSNGPTSDASFRQLPNAGLVPGAANTVKGSVDGSTTSDLAVATCSLSYQFTQWLTGTGWRCGLSPVLPSRAVAATLNLAAFSAVTTQGYATPGDGGGAVFKNVGATAFRDSFVTSVAIAANGTGSCTNGSYLGKFPTGGTGTNLTVNVTVAGNVVSAVTVEDTGGNGYTVGNVLTITGITGCSGAVSISISAVSTPSGSFTDAGGVRFQIVPDGGGLFVNVRQFGAKVDYAGVDATATDDRVSIQNAYNFCADIHGPTIDGGGSAGCRVFHPPGNSLVCGSVPLHVAQGVAVEGANMWASTLKMCAAWADNVNFMNICDPDTHLSCFASYIRNLTLYSTAAQTSNAGISMVYSNSIQQVDVLDRVAIYAGRRRCLTLETGYGGAALLGVQNLECTPGVGGVNPGIIVNYGTTLVNMRNVHVETGSATISGMVITGGFVTVNGFHTEGITTGIETNIPGSTVNGFVRLFDLTGGNGCTNLVLRQGASAANTVYGSGLTPNGCTNTVNNGGVLTTTFVGAWTLY